MLFCISDVISGPGAARRRACVRAAGRLKAKPVAVEVRDGRGRKLRGKHSHDEKPLVLLARYQV